jgi:hypothetical protein
LITKKRADFEIFKKAYEIIINKEHLKPEGLSLIVALKAEEAVRRTLPVPFLIGSYRYRLKMSEASGASLPRLI